MRALPFAVAALATIGLCVAAGGFAGYYYLRPALPSVAEMREIPLQIPLRIYSRDGRLMQQIGEQRRTPVAYEGEDGNMAVDPRIEDETTYRLRAESPLVDQGDPALMDLDGTRSDIGLHGGPEAGRTDL